jgi:hypothetical protein
MLAYKQQNKILHFLSYSNHNNNHLVLLFLDITMIFRLKIAWVLPETAFWFFPASDILIPTYLKLDRLMNVTMLISLDK